MNVMDVVSVLPEIKVALASVVIVGRVVLLAGIYHDRAATAHRRAIGRSAAGECDGRGAEAVPSLAIRSLQAVIVAAQTATAALTTIEWLCTTNIM